MAKEEQEEEVPRGGRKGKKLIIILLVSSVLGGVGALAVIKTVFGDRDSAPSNQDSNVDDGDLGVDLDPIGDPVGEVAGVDDDPIGSGEAAGPTVKGRSVMALEPFVVNLDEPGTPRYLKINVQLELGNEEVGPELNRRAAQVRDSLIAYLSSLRVRDALGDVAKTDIKQNVKRRLNNILETGIVKQVYLTEFVVR